jgi:preprotein translocase subunit SecE
MGCDIHLYIEKKSRGIWKPFDQIPREDYPDERNYNVFALLAGVRGQYKKVYFPNRGIPVDTSYRDKNGPEVDSFIWLGDHSFTYATIHELKKVNWQKYLEYEPQFARFLKQYFPLTSFGDKNIRILMGFDS